MKIYNLLLAPLLPVALSMTMEKPLALKGLVPQRTLSLLENNKPTPTPKALQKLLALVDNLHDCITEAEDYQQDKQEILWSFEQKKLVSPTYHLLAVIKGLAQQNPANRTLLESSINAIVPFTITYPAFTAIDFPEVDEDCPDDESVNVTTDRYVQKMLKILRKNSPN